MNLKNGISIASLAASITLLGTTAAHAKNNYEPQIESCGNTTILSNSGDVSPIESSLYILNSLTGYEAIEDYRLQYKGNNIYQVKAQYDNKFNFIISDANNETNFYVPVQNVPGAALEAERLNVNESYTVNWEAVTGFSRNAVNEHGEILFTLILDADAMGDSINVGKLKIDYCGEPNKANIITDSNKLTPVSTHVAALGANGGISVDKYGYAYVNQYGNWTPTGGDGTHIYKVSPYGDVSVFTDGLNGPVGSYLDDYGNLYVINNYEDGSRMLLQVSQGGQQTVIADIEGTPTNIAQDEQGNLYVSHVFEPVITKVFPDGSQEIFVEHDDVMGTVGFIYDKHEKVFLVASAFNGKIVKVDLDGNVSDFAQIPGSIGYITRMGNRYYATGISNGRIYQISPKGKVTRLAGSGVGGSKDGVSQRAEFFVPNGIAADKRKGVLYVSEFVGDLNLRKIQLKK